jgi:hypothetical protein
MPPPRLDVLPTFEEYCRLIASLPEQFPFIQSSTLAAYTIGPFSAEVQGQITFPGGYVLDSYPHHKHIAPDIKHHRVPAPEISFTRPNLPELVAHIEQLTAA